MAVEGGQQLAGGLQRVAGDPDGAGEDVGGAAGQRGEGGGRPGQAVGRLVERAVAAHGHDHVDAVVGRAVGEALGVPPPARLGHGQIVIGGEGLGDDDPGPGGHRRRGGVDDQQDSHVGRRGRRAGQGSMGRNQVPSSDGPTARATAPARPPSRPGLRRRSPASPPPARPRRPGRTLPPARSGRRRRRCRRSGPRVGSPGLRAAGRGGPARRCSPFVGRRPQVVVPADRLRPRSRPGRSPGRTGERPGGPASGR